MYDCFGEPFAQCIQAHCSCRVCCQHRAWRRKGESCTSFIVHLSLYIYVHIYITIYLSISVYLSIYIYVICKSTLNKVLWRLSLSLYVCIYVICFENNSRSFSRRFAVAGCVVSIEPVKKERLGLTLSLSLYMYIKKTRVICRDASQLQGRVCCEHRACKKKRKCRGCVIIVLYISISLS